MRWCSEQVPLEGLEAGVAGLCAASHEDRPRWFFALLDGTVRGVDLDGGPDFFTAKLPFTFDRPGAATLVTSRDGRWLAVVQARGLLGAVFDVERGVLVRDLARGDYHPDVSSWAVVIRDDVLIAATEWNRLEAVHLPTGERLAPSSTESSFDYFFGEASLSPSGKRLVTFGWHWQPVGAVRVIELDEWLATRADPPPMPFEPLLADWWDADVCWLDEDRLVLNGTQLEDGDWFLGAQDGLVVYDLKHREKLEHFWPGQAAAGLAFDGARLVLLGETTRALDPTSGEVVARLDAPSHAWHPGTRSALFVPALAGKVGPLAHHWLTGTLAPSREAPERVTPEALEVLGDALEERGGNAAAVAHCRAPGPHGRRCWVIEGLR